MAADGALVELVASLGERLVGEMGVAVGGTTTSVGDDVTVSPDSAAVGA